MHSTLQVMYRQLPCAGKMLHDEHEEVNVDDAIDSYKKECKLMSSLHHPNITLFFGLYFDTSSILPLIVMEKLETSLDELLEHIPNLPLSLKHSVLKDVASGLLCLHKMQPPVIHRDLTASNVLLTSSLVAKISDMGNSCTVDLNGRMVKTLTKKPGASVYMPPEALDEDHRYGPSLDVFSFGHLALLTLSQVACAKVCTAKPKYRKYAPSDISGCKHVTPWPWEHTFSMKYIIPVLLCVQVSS